MTIQKIFNEKMKPFEKVEQHVEFQDDKTQIYFELQEGSPRVLISFLDTEDKEVMSKTVPAMAFIKPYTNKAKLYIINTSEKEDQVKFKVVTGVRLL